MRFSLSALSDLPALPFDTIIDARAPSEYAEDHIPGALNLPVLSDEERARVGTIYVQDSPFLARKLGAALVARNAAQHLEGPLADREGGWRPLVYCWRGGQRSGSFATILQQVGWRVSVLEGGYQSYRRQVVSQLYTDVFPVPVVLLDGNTGTAKTDILHEVAHHPGRTDDRKLIGARPPDFRATQPDEQRQHSPQPTSHSVLPRNPPEAIITQPTEETKNENSIISRG